MAQPLSFRWDEEFIARIDAARGLVPRSAFVRAAVEQALEKADLSQAGNPGLAERAARSCPAPTPAERHRRQPGPNVENIRSSEQAKRGTGPRPKKGK